MQESQTSQLKKCLFMICRVLSSSDFFVCLFPSSKNLCLSVLNTGLNAVVLLPSLNLQFFNSN